MSLTEYSSNTLRACSKLGNIFRTDERPTLRQFMDTQYTLPPAQALNGPDWSTRPPQVGLMVLMTHFGIRELIIAKCTQWGVTQMALALMMWVTVYRGESWVYYMPDARSSERLDQSVKHWINTVDIVGDHFVPKNTTVNHPGSRKDEKWFIRANQYYLGGGTSSNTSTFPVVGAIIDEFAKVKKDVQNQGSLIGAARGRFSGSKTGGVIRGFSTHNHVDSVLVTQIENIADSGGDNFYCEVKCPKCSEFSCLHWGNKDDEYGIKFDSEGSVRDRADSVRHVCRHCKDSWVQDDLPKCWSDPKNYPFDSAEEYCRWVSTNGLWIDTDDGHVKTESGEKVKAPLNASVEICPDGMGLYGVKPWSVAVMDCIKGVAMEKQYADVGDIQRFENEYRGIPFLREKTEEINISEFMSRREHYAHRIPKEVIFLTIGVDFGKGYAYYQIDGHGLNGAQWAIEARRIDGDAEDSESRIYQALDEMMGSVHITEDGRELMIALAIMDGGYTGIHASDNVKKLAAKDSDRRIVVIGSSSQNVTKPLFQYKDNGGSWDADFGCWVVSINPHKASQTLYTKLKIPDGSDSYYHFPIHEDFNRLYADGIGADVPVQRGRSGFVYYENVKQKEFNEPHDTAKYNQIAVKVALEFGLASLEPEEDRVFQQPVATQVQSNFDPFAHVQ